MTRRPFSGQRWRVGLFPTGAVFSDPLCLRESPEVAASEVSSRKWVRRPKTALSVIKRTTRALRTLVRYSCEPFDRVINHHRQAWAQELRRPSGVSSLTRKSLELRDAPEAATAQASDRELNRQNDRRITEEFAHG